MDPREIEPPEMDHSSGWKASAYTPEMGELILLRIACGETVKEITADDRMPSYATVYRCTHVIPEFGEAWRAVRLDVAEIARAEEAEDRAAKAAASKRRWRSGRRSTFTACMGLRVCWEIEQGASLSEVVAMDWAPSFRAIYRWLRNSAWFREAYGKACDFRGFVARETARDMAVAADASDWPRVKREVARLEGRAGRMRPRKYAARAKD